MADCVNGTTGSAPNGVAFNATDLPIFQQQFTAASAQAQQAASAADSVMTQSNSQSSADATNIQNINQLGSTMNILGYVANLLAH
jgi:hypothetical protein